MLQGCGKLQGSIQLRGAVFGCFTSSQPDKNMYVCVCVRRDGDKITTLQLQ